MPDRDSASLDHDARAAAGGAFPRRAELESTLLDTSRFARMLAILSEPAPPEQLLDKALETLSELFFADIVVLLDPVGTGTCAAFASIGIPEDMVQRPFRGDEGGYVARVMESQAPLVTEEAGTDPLVDPRLRSLGVHTTAWLPVIGARSPRGVLILARCHPEPFDRADMDLLNTLTHRVGLALEKLQKNAQLSRIEGYGRDVGRYLDEAAVATEAVHAFPAVVAAAGAALVSLATAGKPRCIARAGFDPAWDDAWCLLAATLLRRPSSAAAEPFSVTDAPAALAGFVVEQPSDFPVRALLAAPLRRDEQTLGFLVAARFTPALFPPDSLQAAMLFCGQTAAALENARLYMAVRDDLAERMRMEEEKTRLESRLHQAQRLEAIGTFAGGIAHDYSNLLLSVSGNLELACEGIPEGTEARQAVENALLAALHASDLTRRFTIFTDGGAPVTAFASLSELVVDSVTRALEGSRVRVEYRLPPDLWAPRIDPVQIRQALGAIAKNAREATRDGGAILVTAENVTAPSDTAAEETVRFVAVAVTDHGPGIPQENLPRIFDPYFTTKQRGEARGMGLGLALAHAIVTRHGGRIEVDTVLSAGSTFRVLLPVGTAGRAAVEVAGEPGRPAGSLRILLLEDERTVANVMIRMLRRLGYNDVEHAAEGAVAVVRFCHARDAGTPFQLALLDLSIRGGMEGAEAGRRLLEMDPALAVIASSGYSADPVIARYREYGFRGVLLKPFRMEELSKTIRDALGREEGNL